MLVDAIVALARIGHARGGTLVVLGIVFVVIGAFTFTFRRALARRDQAGLRPHPPRHDTAPGSLKRLYPTPGSWYHERVGPAISVLFVVVGLVLIAVR